MHHELNFYRESKHSQKSCWYKKFSDIKVSWQNSSYHFFCFKTINSKQNYDFIQFILLWILATGHNSSRFKLTISSLQLKKRQGGFY